MSSESLALPGSKKLLWTGRVVSTLVVLMLVFSGAMKLFGGEEIAKEFTKFGYSGRIAVGIGIVELACVAIYAFPRTAVLGAILLTGYLGGATATHVRIDDPFHKVISPVIGGVLVWGALYLRDARLRSLVPWRS